MQPAKAIRNVLVFLPLIAASLFNLPATAATTPNKSRSDAAATALPKGIQFVSSVEGISEYRLANGLKVLLSPDPSKQTITVNITYLVGSRQENYGETGMAHLLEHLLFKGTPKHRNIPQELTQRGARPNGTTWLDRTNYFETFSASDDNLDWALGLEADRMVNSFIARKDLDSEMTVVRNEFEAGENQPFSVLMKRITGAAYDWHNYGNSTIGNRSDIENVAIERLQAFYRQYYQPDNAVLLVAGRIDTPKTLALIGKYFARIARPKRTIEPLYTVEPTQDGERLVAIRRVGDTQLLAAAYHIASGQHPDSAPLNVLAMILGDTPNGRLHKALVETGKATSAGTYGIDAHDPGLLLAFATLRKQDSLEAARDTLLKVVENFAAEPPTAEEVNRAKIKFAAEFDRLTANTEQLGVALSEVIALGDWRLLYWTRDQVRAVTPADVQWVAQHYLKRDNRTLAEFIPVERPDRAEIPPRPDVVPLLKDYKGSAIVAVGEAIDPTQENIDKRTIRSSLPVGMKLALLPKTTRGNVVNVQLQLHFGDEQSLQNRKFAPALVGSMLARGTKRLTRKEISDEFDRLKAQVAIGGGAEGAHASIQTVRENLPKVLELVAEIFREPSFPADELDSLKREIEAQIESQRREPQGVAVNQLQRLFNVYPRGDPRYVGTFDEQLTGLSLAGLEEVQRFHSEFYGASNADLAIVGDFDPKEIGLLAETLFGQWKSPAKYERLAAVYRDIPATSQVLDTPDKANAFFIVRENLKMRDDDPDYPALELGNYMLGGGFLNSRLSTRIRQKEGLSYGVGSQLAVSAQDQAGAFSGYAIAAPQNTAKLETAFKEEIVLVLKDGFAAAEVAAAKQGWLDSRKLNRAQDRIVVSALANNLYLGRTFQWSAEFEKKIQALTPEGIRDALRRHIDPTGLSIVKAGDFSKSVKQ